jgi:hypothetical protein
MQCDVFLVSRSTDVADDLIALELERRGVPFRRINVDDFPRDCQVVFDPDAARLVWGEMDVSCLLSGKARVWSRGIRYPRTAETSRQRYVEHESCSLLSGIFATSPPQSWVTHPDRLDRASRKPLQLTVARSLGLMTPRKLMTNSSAAAREHMQQTASSIVKPVSGGVFLEDGAAMTVYSAQIHFSDIPAEGLFPPVCLQNRVSGTDVRAYVIGTEVFAVRIETVHEYADWRRSPDDEVRYVPVTLPATVERALINLTAHFELPYGAIDLITSGSDYVFLEVNPSGQWAWIEDATEIPLTRRLVDQLLRE